LPENTIKKYNHSRFGLIGFDRSKIDPPTPD
jgi:hypothetical protein